MALSMTVLSDEVAEPLGSEGVAVADAVFGVCQDLVAGLQPLFTFGTEAVIAVKDVAGLDNEIIAAHSAVPRIGLGDDVVIW